MGGCKWMQDEVCVNADCPMCADFCPVANCEGVCRFEERKNVMYEDGLFEVSGANDERIPLEEVLEDMCFHEVGWIQTAAEAYYHKEYLGEVRVKNKNKKWWQFWKSSYIWEKEDGK